MSKGLWKIPVCCMTTVFLLSITPRIQVEAGNLVSNMPGAGIASLMNDADTAASQKINVETEKPEAVETSSTADQMFGAGVSSIFNDYFYNSLNADPQKEQKEENEYEDIAIAQVTNYVNIRDHAGEDGEVVGKLYNNSAAFILQAEGDWYQIKSGTVTGYVKSEFVVSGDEGVELAKQVGHRTATVNTETLKVRNDPGLDATVQTLIPLGESYEVVGEEGDWVKIAVDTDIEGYVSTEFVDVATEFVQAESKAEEEARLAREAEVKRAAEEAAKQADAKKNGQKKQESTTQQAITAPAAAAPAAGSSRASVVSYALQFVGYPYRAGGTSLTNGVDCSGFTSSVFRDSGVSIPRDSRSQASSGTPVDIANVQPGDLLFYSNGNRINHVALYIGNGQVVHASTAKTGIKISSYNYRTPCKAVSYLN